MKKLLIMTMLVATAFQLKAQGIDPDPGQYYHPFPYPAPTGTYNNPIKVYANLGEQVTMGDYHVGLTSPWYYVTGWWNQPQVPGEAGVLHPYLTVWGHYTGQFLIKFTESGDYYHGVIYAVADPGHGNIWEFFRILKRPPANQGVIP